MLTTLSANCMAVTMSSMLPGSGVVDDDPDRFRVFLLQRGLDLQNRRGARQAPRIDYFHISSLLS